MNYGALLPMLQTGFRYDLWANLRWYNSVRLMKEGEAGSAVLQHILTTQRTWLDRCGVPVAEFPRAATRKAFEAINGAWLTLLETRSMDDSISYHDSRGRERVRPLGEIAWHVINHGTYHRGHLRGLAQNEQFDEFGDTDLVLFFDEARKG